ncbi:hypothetical protein [Flagellimonas onchidii]|uniref:hypothetical protein n=1 Tax=Flagellimonas onchidii TaxID=2562684 RepID=UPI0010A5D510|nr:hypothetical protein [Allomuricauda onchidii]
MKKPLHIIKTWFETGDVPTQQQFWDTFDSFHHKDNGEMIVEKSVNGAGDVTFKFSDNKELTIEKFVPDVSKPMGYIEGLVKTLGAINNGITTLRSGKVDKEEGKGLSETNFTRSEKEKLEGLKNYTHPGSHPISFVDGLQDILGTLVQDMGLKEDKVDGKGLSSNDYTDGEKQKLADLNLLAFGRVVDTDGNSIEANGQSDVLTFEGATIDETEKKVIIPKGFSVRDENDIERFKVEGFVQFEGFSFDPIQKKIAINVADPRIIQNENNYKIHPKFTFHKFSHHFQTGAIKIKVPNWINDYIRLTIEVQSYSDDKNLTYTFSAFHRNDRLFKRWEKVTIYDLQKSPVNTAYKPTIRLGNNGTDSFIYLGDLDETHYHSTIVYVKEITLGGYGAALDMNTLNNLIDDPWEFSLETTAFETIDKIQTF